MSGDLKAPKPEFLVTVVRTYKLQARNAGHAIRRVESVMCPDFLAETTDIEVEEVAS